MKTSSPAAVVARGSSISSPPSPLAIGKLGLATVLSMFFLAASAAAQSTTIVISEFRTRGPGGVTDEFIEIYNKSCASVAIGGFKLKYSSNSGSISTLATVAAGTNLAAGKRYLFGRSGGYTGSVDATYTTGLTDDGGLAFTDAAGVVIDQVGMSSGSAYGEGTRLSPLSGTSNQSYERHPGGASGNATDVNDNASDFFFNASSSNPQTSAAAANLVTVTTPTSCVATPSSYCAGTVSTITLTSAGGSGTTMQWFAGACGTTLVGTGSPLTITAPSVTTTYYVRWTAPCVGDSACGSVTVTVSPGYSDPTSASSNITNFCGTPSGNITLTAVGGSGSVLNWGDRCNGTVIGTGSPLTIAAPTSTTTYYCWWSSPGCGDSRCANVTVNVTPNPATPTSPVASPATICSGGSTSLSVRVNSGEVVDWFSGSCGGTAVGTGNPLSVSPSATTTYYARARKLSTGCVSNNCASVVVTVGSTPVAPTSATSSITSFCGTPSGNITLTAVGGSGTTLKWYTGSCGGTFVANGSPLTLPAPTSTTTFYARWTTASCGNSACASVTVTVNPLPATPTGPTASPSTVCSGTAVNLSARVNSGEVIDWFSGSCGGTPVGTGNPLSVTPTATTTYFGRARKTATGCVSTNCASVTVTVNPAPVAPTSASSSITTFCGVPTGNVSLTAVGGSGTTLKWYSGSCGGTFVGTGSPLSIAAPSATTTYYALWNTTTCGNSACASVTVTVNPLPATPTGVAASASPICAGGSTSLSATVGSGQTVDWFSGSCGGTAAGTGSPLIVSPTATTTYFARARNTTTGCVSVACASVTVTVDAAPVAPTSASSSITTFCGVPTGNISLTAVGGSGATLKWYSGSCGGTFVGTGSPLSIAAPAATTTYYAAWNTTTCGNSACASVTVTINPLPATPTGVAANPATICPNATTSLSATVGAGQTVDWFSGSCGGTAAGTGSPLVVSPTTTTTYFARARNTTTGCVSAACASVTVTVADTTPPVLTGCPSAAGGTISCLSALPAPAVVTAMDACAGSVTVTYSQMQSNPGSNCNNTVTRTWTAVDPSANVASCTQTFTVNDATPPVLTVPPASTIVCPQTPSFGTPTATDGCGAAVTISQVGTDLIVPSTTTGCNSYDVTRTWIATDSCGNASAPQSTVIHVVDDVAPTITCPPNVTMALGGSIAPTIPATGTATIAVVSPFAGGPSYFRSTITNGGVLNGTYAGWCVDTDLTIPSGVGHSAVYYSDYGLIPAGYLEQPANLAAVNWILNQNFIGASSPGGFGNYTYGDVQRAIWTLIDDQVLTNGLGDWSQNRTNEILAGATTLGAGFVPSCGQRRAVVIVPVNSGGTPNHQITIVVTTLMCEPTVSDGCSLTTTTFADVPGTGCPLVVVRTWTATDACGNAASCSQTITLVDTTPPVLNVPANSTISLPDVPSFGTPTAFDGSGGPATIAQVGSDVITPSTAAGCSSYTVTRTWTATDSCGNVSAPKSTTITVVDDVAPVLTVPAASTISCGTTPDFGTPTAVDAAGSAVTVTQVGSDVTTPSTTAGCNSYDVTRTWIATDACGNASAPQSTTISVVDTVAPVLTVPAASTVSCGTTPVFGTPSAVDACGSAVTITQVGADVTTPSTTAGCNSYDVTRTWIATDACGNASAPQSTTISVVDTIAPVLTVPALTTISCGTTPVFGTPSAVDACGSAVTITQVGSDVTTPSTTAGCNAYDVTRTWIATDACGNASAPQSTTISVVDTIAPVLTVPAASTISCGTTPVFGTPSAVDACGSAVTITQVGSDVTTPSTTAGCNAYDVTRTWIATDACGNASAPQSTTISVVDTIAPVLTVPAPTTISCGTTPVFGTPSAVDACGSAVTITQVGSDVTTPSTTAGCNAYDVTRTWVATDACGNASAPQSTTISVVDTLAPVLTVPAASTISLPATPNFAAPTAVDACGSAVTITQVGSDVTTPSTTAGCNSYDVTRTWIATDACGNASAPQSTTISVVDTIAPVLTVPAPTTISCGTTPVFGTPSAVDACGSAVTITQVGSDVTTPSTTAGCNSYDVTRTWIATDACGNASAPQSTTISVVDTIAPVLTVPAPTTISCGTTPVFGTPSAVDACGSAVTITQVGSDVTTPSTTAGCNSYDVTRTWIATDACGNASAPQSTTISVVDTIAPVLTVPAASTISCGTTPVFGTPSAVDACGSAVTIMQVGADVTTPSTTAGCNAYDVTRTWVATDACGNASAPQSTTISVVDTIAPVLTVPAASTVSCGTTPVFGTPSAVDACGSAVTITQVGSDVTTPSTTAGCNSYDVTRTWVATDACGNASAPQSTTISVVDTIAPVLSVPAASTISCGTTPVFGTPSAVDACGSAVTITQVGSDVTTPSTTAGCNSYDVTRTWIATDACGNASAPQSTTISVVDTIAPVLSVPAASTISCGTTPVFGTPSAVDACGSAVTITQVGADVTTPSTTAGCNAYDVTRTWIATDACGNASAPQSTTISVVDTIAPVLTVPAPTTISCGTTPVFGTPSAVDACGSAVTITQVGADVTTPSTTAGCNAYDVTRTWIATDACGNASAPQSTTISVVDTIAPVLTVPAASTISCGTTPDFGTPSAVDACGSAVTITQVGSDVTTPSTTAGCNSYDVTRTWIATDACGNASAPQSTTISVVDTVAPVLSVPAASTISCGTTPVFGTPSAVDACGSAVTITQVGADVTTPSTTAGCNSYDVTRTWIATDACGNASAPQSTTISVVDTVAPVLSVPAASTISCGTTPVFGTPSAVDACGSAVTITQVGSDVTTPSTTAGCNSYDVTRTWIATDACGNASAPQSTTISVVDTIAPVLTVPAASTISCGTTPDFGTPSAVDACGSAVTITQVGSELTTPSTTAGCNSYDVTRTWIATDACGNASAPQSTTISVVDTIAPVLTVPAASTISCGTTPVFGTPSAVDACGSAVTITQVGSDVTTPSTTAGCNAYDVTRTWIATDACGNASAPQSTTISVVDTIAPVLTVPAASTISCGTTPVFGTPSAVDACGSAVTITQVGSDVTTPSTTAGCNSYDVTRTWIATDACGNASAPQSTTISVVDTIAPVLTVPAASTISCGTTPVFGTPSAVDACGSAVTIMQVGADVTTPSTTAGCNSYDVTRTWIATDACGNASAPQSTTISVVDTIAPVLTVPAPTTISCGTTPVFGTPSAVDACGSAVTITQVGSDVTTPSTTAGCNSYDVTRTWIATDACGNASAPQSTTISVVDTIAPVLTVPAASTISCGTTPDFGTPSAVDACGSAVTITQVGSDLTTPSTTAGCNSYDVTRTWIATDACGNASAPQSTTISVVDTVAPVLSVPAASTIALPATPSFAAPTAVDACGSAVTITQVGSDVTTPSTLVGCNSYTVTRTWIATDACGNASAPQSTTITVVDDAAPVLTVPPEATINFPMTPSFGTPTALDAAGSATTITQVGTDLITPSTTAGCNSYDVTRTWIATDSCGNASAAQSTTIHVVDNAAPILTVPAASTISCGTTPVFGTPTAVDAAGSAVTVTQVGSDVTTPSTTAGCNSYDVTRTWIATDACGNASAPQSTTISVVDTIAPVLTVPAASTISCGTTPDFGTPSAVDACGSAVTITQVGSDVTTPSTTAGCNSYDVTRTWIATDACGNASAPQSTTISVVDTIAPVLTVPAASTISCGTTPVFGTPSAVDACGSAVTITQVGSDVTTPSTTAGCNSYDVTRTWIATDACGNASAPQSTTISVVDTIAPVLTVPAASTIALPATPNFAAPTAVDACGSAVTITQVGSDVTTPSTLVGCNSYTVTRTWIATDACGNASAPQSTTITVVDNAAPVLTVPPEATINFPITPSFGTPTALDAAGSATTITQVGSDVITPSTTAGCNSYDVTRTWIATDSCGNASAAQSTTIHVVDNAAPILTVPASSTISCGTTPVFGTPTAVDAAGSAVTVTQVGSDVTTPSTTAGCNSYDVTRTWIATDACGNASAPQSTTISVVDTVAPVLSVPAASTISCGTTPVFGTPSAVDACGSAVTITQVGSDVTTPSTTAGCNSYDVTRTWIATDACGNASAPQSTTISVVDTIAPVLSVPAASTIALPATPSFAAPTAVDACGSAVTITQVGSDVTTPSTLVGCNSYTVTRTWIATDACGNASAPQSTTITVSDNAAPVLTVPADGTIYCGQTPIFGTPTAVDAAGSAVTITQVGSTVLTPSTLFGCSSFDLTRTWIATDACGNASAPKSTTIHVVDDVAPVLTVPANSTIACGTTPNFGVPTAVDACSSTVVITQIGSDLVTPSALAGCGAYTVVRTWIAVDGCGNASAPQSTTITVVDTVAPVFTFVPPNLSLQIGAPTPPVGTPTASDGCSTTTIAYVGETPGSDACRGFVTRTWTATDGCGNVATATQIIDFVDTVPPTLVCFGGLVGSANGTSVIPDYASLSTASDDSGSVVVTQSPAPGTPVVGPPQTILVTVTATDPCGNTATCQSTYVVTNDLSASIDLGGGCGFPGPRLFSSYPEMNGFGTLAVVNADPAGTIFLFVDPQPFDVPFFRQQCLIWVDPFSALILGPFPVSPLGDWALTTFVPDAQVLLNFEFMAQVVIFAPSGPLANGAYVTNGVQTKVGTTAPYCTQSTSGFAGAGPGGTIFDLYYETVFAGGLTIGEYVPGNGSLAPNGLTWVGDDGGRIALKAFLGDAAAPSGALASDAADPTLATDGGVLAQQTATLALNLGFNAAGVLGGNTNFGTNVYLNIGVADSLSGYTVSLLLTVADQALAGYPLPSGYTYDSLAALIGEVNASFDGCVPTTWSNLHVFNPVTPP